MSKEKVNVKYYFDEKQSAEYDEVMEKHPDMFQSFGQQTFNGGYHEGLSEGYNDGQVGGLLAGGAALLVTGLAFKYVPKILKKIKK